MGQYICAHVERARGLNLASFVGASGQFADSHGIWESISIDFVFGLPKDAQGNKNIVVFVDRLSDMAHLASVPDSINGQGTAQLFIDRVFR